MAYITILSILLILNLLKISIFRRILFYFWLATYMKFEMDSRFRWNAIDFLLFCNYFVYDWFLAYYGLEIGIEFYFFFQEFFFITLNWIKFIEAFYVHIILESFFFQSELNKFLNKLQFVKCQKVVVDQLYFVKFYDIYLFLVSGFT